MELKFEHFNYKESLSKQRELFKDCFPETNGDRIQSTEHYLWKFHSFPNEIKSWEYSVILGDEMVGYYAALPYKYYIGKTQTNVAMVCDVMTSTKQRGKGIFTKIGLYATDDLADNVPFTIGYPIRKEVIPGHMKVGWKIAFQLPLYIKFFKLDSLLKKKKIGFLSYALNPFLTGYNYFQSNKIDENYSGKLFDNIEDINDYGNFVKKWEKTVRNHLIKDLNFAKWRYSAPGRFYKFLSISFGNEMVGFISFRKVIKEGVPSYGILDYMVLPEHSNCHGLINETLKAEAKKEKVECLLCMMSKYSAKRYKLSENGFHKSPFTFQLIIKKLTSQFLDNELFNEDNWHLMWIDSDDL